MNSTVRMRRPIRSFVRREGRFTDAQRRAFAALLPRYGVPEGDAVVDPAALFGRSAAVHLEIGFGNGATLAAMAAAHPENNYLGIEVHRPGVGTLLRRIEMDGLANIRVACADAVETLHRIPDAALDAVYIFFPDPWPKKRHHKRRLVQPAFLALVQRKLKPGGVLALATDWEEYAQHMLAMLSASGGFENLAGPGRFAPRAAGRPETRFEQRGRQLGHRVRDLAFRRAG